MSRMSGRRRSASANVPCFPGSSACERGKSSYHAPERRLRESQLPAPPPLDDRLEALVPVAEDVRLDDASLTRDALCGIAAGVDRGRDGLDDDVEPLLGRPPLGLSRSRARLRAMRGAL